MSTSVRVSSMGDTLSGKSVSSRVKRSDRWYGRVPASVLLDPSISSDAIRVYGLLSLSVYQGSTARVGMRQLGKVIGKGAATIKRRIYELVAAGHMKANTGRPGQRAYYELTSPVFGQKQGRETVVVRGDSGVPRYASMEKTA